MQKWKISEIWAGFINFFKCFSVAEVSVETLFFETTDTHVLDIIGESPNENKVTCEKFWSIRVDEDNKFTVEEKRILWGGEFVEREVYLLEDYSADKATANLKYAEAVRRMWEKSLAYTDNLPPLYHDRYCAHSYVLLEKRKDGVPVVKWVTMEYVYYEEYTEYHECQKVASADIDAFSLTFEDRDYDAREVQSMAMTPANYFSKIHLTRLHIEADIFYEVYGGERRVWHLDEVYKDFSYLKEEFLHFKENLKKGESEE